MTTKEAFEKGTTAALTRKWLIERFGEEAPLKITSQLSPETREMFETPAPNQWYSQMLLRELYEKIDAAFGNGDPNFFREYGRYDAARTTSGPLRYLLRLASGVQVLKRAQSFWKHYFKGSILEIKDLSEDEGHVNVKLIARNFNEGVPGCRILEGYFEVVFTKTGVKNLEIKEESCVYKGDEYCSWNISWQE